MSTKHKKLKWIKKSDLDDQIHRLLEKGEDLWFKSTQMYLEAYPAHKAIIDDPEVSQKVKDYVTAAIDWTNTWHNFRQDHFED